MSYWAGPSVLYDSYVQLDVIVSDPGLTKEARVDVEKQLLNFYHGLEKEELP